MRVLLDTCVLYPPHLRNLLLDLAAQGAFAPLWSTGIAAEWLHLASRRGPDGVAGADIALCRMRAAFPGGEVTEAAARMDATTADLPDAGDMHVLAAALAGGAALILTANLRDFPPRVLAPYGLRAQSPDDFVMDHWLKAPALVEGTVTTLWPGLSGPTLRRALKKAGLPRLGKALGA